MATIFEDTFTGSGQLSAHTSDSGGTWANKFPFGHGYLGGGYLHGAATSGIVQCQAVPSAQIGGGNRVRARVDFVGATQGGSFTGSQRTYISVSFIGESARVGFSLWNTNPSSGYILDFQASFPDGSQSAIDRSALVDGANSIEFLADGDAGTMEMTVNGSAMGTFVFDPTDITGWQFDIEFEGRATSPTAVPGIIIDYLLIDDAATPPPGRFWTNLKRTTEVP